MILDGTILVGDLANNAIETVKIKNANLTNVKLDKVNIPLSGFGATAADVALGDNKLTGVKDPTLTQDAATKNYVDNVVKEVADELTAIAAQTSFTLTQTPSANSKVKMFINGIRISNTAYSITGTCYQ